MEEKLSSPGQAKKEVPKVRNAISLNQKRMRSLGWKSDVVRWKKIEKGLKRRKVERRVGLSVTLPSFSLCVGGCLWRMMTRLVSTRVTTYFLACSLSAAILAWCVVFAVWCWDAWNDKVQRTTGTWMNLYRRLWLGPIAGVTMVAYLPEGRPVSQRVRSSPGRTDLCEGRTRK